MSVNARRRLLFLVAAVFLSWKEKSWAPKCKKQQTTRMQ